MKIFWFDKGYVHQSAGIPDLPTPDEALMVFSPGLKHSRVNVIGCEMWRIPVLHRLIEDGHEIVWGFRSGILPNEALDFDLQRLGMMYPDFADHVHDVDPMLQFMPPYTIHNQLEKAYFQEVDPDKTQPGWVHFKKWVDEERFGRPPEVDVAVIIALRANVINAWEQSYLLAMYIKMGVPVILYDQDRQLTGFVSICNKLEIEWPNPLITIIAPYDEATSAGKPEIIDYPYIDKFERTPVPIAERTGAMYVGNDYDRRDAMERLLFPLADTMPVKVWGKYDSEDAQQWKDKLAETWNIDWAGRLESCRVPGEVASAHLTVNVVKKNYMRIGLLTMRTFDSNAYGTLQIADRKIKRIEQWVPDDYLATTPEETLAIGKKIMNLTDEQYAEELERQRELTRKNNLDAYMTRLYELIELARAKTGVTT